MEYTHYVARRRAKFKSLAGQVNIPYGTALENQGGALILNGKRLCLATSQNACDYFSQNDDGRGLERGALVSEILSCLEQKPHGDGKAYQARWDKVSADQICQQYRRTDHEDFWLWSQAFYDAPIDDLQHIAQLVRGGGRKR